MTDIEPRYHWEQCKQRNKSLESSLVRLAKLVGFSDESRQGIGGGNPEYEPTEDEIHAACREIRSGWGVTEERARRVGLNNRRVPFAIREMSVR